MGQFRSFVRRKYLCSGLKFQKINESICLVIFEFKFESTSETHNIVWIPCFSNLSKFQKDSLHRFVKEVFLDKNYLDIDFVLILQHPDHHRLLIEEHTLVFISMH
jgi:hypothetical protein